MRGQATSSQGEVLFCFLNIWYQVFLFFVKKFFLFFNRQQRLQFNTRCQMNGISAVQGKRHGIHPYSRSAISFQQFKIPLWCLSTFPCQRRSAALSKQPKILICGTTVPIASVAMPPLLQFLCCRVTNFFTDWRKLAMKHLVAISTRWVNYAPSATKTNMSFFERRNYWILI